MSGKIIAGALSAAFDSVAPEGGRHRDLPGLQAKRREQSARRWRLLSPLRGFWGLVVDLSWGLRLRLYAAAPSGL